MSSLDHALHIREAALAIDPADVLGWVESMVDGQYTNAVLATLLVYDSVCTLDREVKYFWKWERPLKKPLMDMVYFMNRYAGILGAVSYFLNSITIILIDYMLMRRVEALHSFSLPYLTRVLRTLLILETIAKFALMIYATIVTDIVLATFMSSPTSPPSYVCGQNFVAAEFVVILDWVIPLAYGVILLVLVLWAAVQHRKQTRGLEAKFGFVRHLAKDQVEYFIAAVAVSFFNSLQIKLSSILVWTNILNGLGSPTLLCILGSRMLLGLKDAGEKAHTLATEEGEEGWMRDSAIGGVESRGRLEFTRRGGSASATESDALP